MGDFKEIFDITRLTPDELGCLEYVLNSPSYMDVFEPYLRNMRDSLNIRLLDRSRERKDEYPDDFLAGGVVAIDGLLSLFKRIVEETQIDRIAASQARLRPEEQYEVDRMRGAHVPILGANEPILPDGPTAYRPEEDY